MPKIIPSHDPNVAGTSNGYRAPKSTALGRFKKMQEEVAKALLGKDLLAQRWTSFPFKEIGSNMINRKFLQNLALALGSYEEQFINCLGAPDSGILLRRQGSGLKALKEFLERENPYVFGPTFLSDILVDGYLDPESTPVKDQPSFLSSAMNFDLNELGSEPWPSFSPDNPDAMPYHPDVMPLDHSLAAPLPYFNALMSLPPPDFNALMPLPPPDFNALMPLPPPDFNALMPLPPPDSDVLNVTNPSLMRAQPQPVLENLNYYYSGEFAQRNSDVPY